MLAQPHRGIRRTHDPPPCRREFRRLAERAGSGLSGRRAVPGDFGIPAVTSKAGRYHDQHVPGHLAANSYGPLTEPVRSGWRLKEAADRVAKRL
jgi:hypothetical protein